MSNNWRIEKCEDGMYRIFNDKGKIIFNKNGYKSSFIAENAIAWITGSNQEQIELTFMDVKEWVKEDIDKNLPILKHIISLKPKERKKYYSALTYVANFPSAFVSLMKMKTFSQVYKQHSHVFDEFLIEKF